MDIDLKSNACTHLRSDANPIVVSGEFVGFGPGVGIPVHDGATHEVRVENVQRHHGGPGEEMRDEQRNQDGRQAGSGGKAEAPTKAGPDGG